MRYIKKIPSKKKLNELFSYNKKTGVVKRKQSRPNAKKGKVVGTPQNKGYLAVSVENQTYLLHRIIWVMEHGDIPKGMVIDHINGDKTDNRIKNLRIVSEVENNKNQKRSIKNKSGCTGVYYKKDRNVWAAEITVNGKKIHLGQYKSKENAISSRKKAEIIYKYHPNHDREQLVGDVTQHEYLCGIVKLVDKEGLLQALKTIIIEYEKKNNAI